MPIGRLSDLQSAAPGAWAYFLSDGNMKLGMVGAFKDGLRFLVEFQEGSALHAGHPSEQIYLIGDVIIEPDLNYLTYDDEFNSGMLIVARGGNFVPFDVPRSTPSFIEIESGQSTRDHIFYGFSFRRWSVFSLCAGDYKLIYTYSAIISGEAKDK